MIGSKELVLIGLWAVYLMYHTTKVWIRRNYAIRNHEYYKEKYNLPDYD